MTARRDGAMAQPLVHVLVINWNGMEHLHACFESLVASTYDNVRFVLLDNGSTDESVAYVRDTFGSDPRVEVLELGENLGWSRGNNVGLEKALEANADYAFLLNNDTWTAPGAIEKLVAEAEADPSLGAVAPKMRIYDSPEILNSLGLVCSVIGNTWDLGIGRLDQAKWDVPREVIGVCGGAALLRVEALRKTGLLPTDYDIYLDDLELSLRIWKHGYRICSCPEASIRHKFSATMGREEQRRRKYFLNTRNRLRVVLRHFPAAYRYRIARAVALGEAKALGRALFDREPWIPRAHAQAWFDVVQTMPATRAARRADPTEHEAKIWDLIVKDRLFFPGTELPVDGWYQPVSYRGRPVRPMSRSAILTVTQPMLRIDHVNPHPELGETHIVVKQHGATVGELRTVEESQSVLTVEPGPIEFHAQRIFDADDTGKRIDIGGWLRVETLDRS